MRSRKPDRLAADIWILGTCDLEVPWALGRDEPVYRDVVHADGFEGADLDGWQDIVHR